VPSYRNNPIHHDDGYDSKIVGPRFLHLRSSAAVDAMKAMVQLFGSILGTKHVAVFVDNCVADLFEACSTRAMSKGNGSDLKDKMFLFCGSDQVDWLYKWIGSLVLANELLVGVFSPVVNLEEDVSEKQTKWPAKANNVASSQYYDARLDKRGKKYILKLTSSILPVMTSAPLWNLPTSMSDVADNESQFNNKRCIENYESSTTTNRPAHKNDKTFFSDCNFEFGHRNAWSEISARALNGNALVICSLIEMIGSLANLLGQNMESFLPTILYPLIEKSNHFGHHYIQKSAKTALKTVAHCTGTTSVYTLVVQNFDYLLEVMSSSMHSLNAGASLNGQWMALPSLPGIVEMLLKSVVKEASAAHNQTKKLNVPVGSCFGSKYVSMLGDLVYKIMKAFTEMPSRESGNIDLLRVFRAVLEYLQLSLDDYEEESDNESVDGENIVGDPWLDVLFEFAQENEDLFIANSNKQDYKYTTGGFPQHHGFKEIDVTDREVEGTDGLESTDSYPKSKVRLFVEETQIAKLILSRCSFLLCSPDLMVQAAACETLVSGFGYLAAIQKYLMITPASNESTGNPLLSSIGEFWPSIMDRFRSAANSFLGAQRFSQAWSPMQKLVYSNNDSNSGDEIYLARLLSLMSSLCTFSGDFLVGRIENDVWPVVARLFKRTMEFYSGETTKKVPREKPGNVLMHCTPFITNTRMEDKKIALHSILDFLHNIFSNKNCGASLSHLIPVAGSMLLPLIANGDSIGASAFLALKSMLTVDSDWILRALFVLIGTEISNKPLIVPSLDMTLVETSEFDDSLSKKAKEILKYIEDLPEQVIV